MLLQLKIQPREEQRPQLELKLLRPLRPLVPPLPLLIQRRELLDLLKRIPRLVGRPPQRHEPNLPLLDTPAVAGAQGRGRGTVETTMMPIRTGAEGTTTGKVVGVRMEAGEQMEDGD